MTSHTQRYSRALAATAMVGLVLPVATASSAAAAEEPFSGFSSESTATPVRLEIYEPTVPIPASPQGEVSFGYTRVEADTGSSRGRASYLWPGDAVGEGFKTIVENLGLPEELSGPIAAQGYPFQVNSTAPSGQESEADEPFPGMVMRTRASADRTIADSGYSTDCQVADAGGDGGAGDGEGGDGDGGGGESPIPGLPFFGSLTGTGGDDATEAGATQAAKQEKSAKTGKETKAAEEPEESCRIPAELAGLVDFGGYASTSSSTNDGSTVAATSRTSLSDVELLGGLITVSGVHARSTSASDGAKGDPGGKAGYGTLAINGQEFSIGPDGIEGGGESQPIPALSDEPAKALEQLGVTITVPKPTYERDGDKAVSSVAALVIEIDTSKLRRMLDDIPFNELVNQIPNETGDLKKVIGAAVNLAPKFVITLGDARTVVDTVQGIEFPTTPTDTPETEDGSAGSGGAQAGGESNASVPTAGGAPGGVPADAGSTPAADGDLTDAAPMGSGLPPLNSIPGALTFGGIALAAAAGTWLRKIGAIALGGVGACPHGLDSGLPDLRKA